MSGFHRWWRFAAWLLVAASVCAGQRLHGPSVGGSHCCCVERNQCSLRAGLFADFIGVDPTASDCASVSVCPRVPHDNGDGSEIVPRTDESTPPSVGVRILVEPDPLDQRCRRRDQMRCCYGSAEDLRRVSAFCSPEGREEEHHGDSGWTLLNCAESTVVDHGEDSDEDVEFDITPRFGSRTCGGRSFSSLSNLPFGRASPDEFPWTCRVLDSRGVFVAACVVVPRNFDNDVSRGTDKVVTVAHRTWGKRDLVVRVGEYDLDAGVRRRLGDGGRSYRVSRLIVHPDFDPSSKRLADNIAVIRIAGSIDLTGRDVSAACLPQCYGMFDYQFANGTGTRCWVAGWGDDAAGIPQSIMRKVDVPILSNSMCEAILKPKTRNLGRIRNGEICAGGQRNRDACSGDGGAPLVCQAPSGRWYAVGLVSWGLGCGLDGVPGVYTRIHHYRSFIEAS